MKERLGEGISCNVYKAIPKSKKELKALIEKYNIDIEKLMNAIDNGFVGRLVDVESGNDKVVVEIC